MRGSPGQRHWGEGPAAENGVQWYNSCRVMRLWRTYDLDRLDQRDPELLERMSTLVEKVHVRYHRAEVAGVEDVPSGAALFVGNHNAGLWSPDTFILGWALHRRYGLDGLPYGLGHDMVLRSPLGQLLVPLGAVRASHDNAHRLFAEGRKVLVYPGGDLEAWRPYRHRNRVDFGPRVGYMRLALREGVPVVPVVAEGAHASFIVIDDLRWLARLIRADRYLRLKVWPLVVCLPWGLAMGPAVLYWPFPARIRMEILPAIRFERSGPEAAGDDAYVRECSRQVQAQMQSALTRLAAQR